MTDVRSIQMKLAELGYDVGGIDGIAGRKTTAAVAKFQADRGLVIKYPGTIGPKTLAALDLEDGDVKIIPPWMTIAQSKLGLHEVRNNKELKTFLKSDGVTLGDPAVLPWCGDFVETCIAIAMPQEPMVTNPYWALNWLKFGEVINIDKPVFGCILVAERNGGGHVGFVVGHDQEFFHVLGGNQSNSVSVMKLRKSRVKGLRMPSTYTVKLEQLPYSVFDGKVSYNEA